MIEEYLPVAELAKRLHLDPKTIQNKMSMGIFQKGIHYFRRPGITPRFKWSAICLWIEERDRTEMEVGVVNQEIEIPMSRGYLLRNGR